MEYLPAERREARAKLIQAANRIRLQRSRYTRSFVFNRASYRPVQLLTRRNLQEAVAIVRFWGAVDADTLAAAGFNSKGRRK